MANPSLLRGEEAITRVACRHESRECVSDTKAEFVGCLSEAEKAFRTGADSQTCMCRSELECLSAYIFVVEACDKKR